jgi:hypothetical protein
MRSGSALVVTAALLAVAAVVAMPTSALARTAAATSNSKVFTDSTGEDPSAPDITTIDLSNDNAGLITFKINISNRPTFTDDMLLDVFLDTDRKASTGDPQNLGADYALELVPGAVTLYKWNGTDFRTAPSQSSVTFGYASTGATIRASARDLGNTKGFNFYADAVAGVTIDSSGNPDFSHVHDDAAPDPGHGLFTYPVLTKLTLSVKAFTTGPKPAKAGKKFVASLAANESDTNGPVEAGTVACSATIGSKHLAATAHRVSNGIASCAWSVPHDATGTLHGSVTLTVQGVKVVRTFAVRVS